MPEVVRDSYRKAEARSSSEGARGRSLGDADSRSAYAPPGRPPGGPLNGLAGAGVPLQLSLIPFLIMHAMTNREFRDPILLCWNS